MSIISNIIKEYLVALGVKDNFTDKLDSSLQKGSQKVSGFVGKWGKQWLLAGGAVVTGLVTANLGVAKFVQKLVTADDELEQFAKDLGVTKDEAYSTKSALDAMGRSLDEIKADPKLLAQFEELREHAEKIKPPDMSEGLQQVRGITNEITKLKQTGAAAIQWIGHYLLKYIAKPMEQVQDKLRGLNETVTKNLPAWSEKIGMALSWIVRLGGTVLRGAGQIFNAIKKIFDMIPGNVKIAMAAFAALALFIRAGPIGQLITILSIALLLLEDFFTYLDGGDALLAPVWKTLVGLFDGFTKGGENALEFFSGEFLPGLFDLIGGLFPKLVDKAMSFVDPLLNFGVKVLEGLIGVIAENLPRLLKMLTGMASYLLNAILEKLPAILNAGTQILTALIEGIVSMIPELVTVAVGLLDNLVGMLRSNLPKIVEAGITLIVSLLKGLVSTIPVILKAIGDLLSSLLGAIIDSLPLLIDAGISIVMALIDGVVNSLPTIIQAIIDLVNSLLSAIIKSLPQIIDSGIKLVMSLINGIVKALPDIIRAAIKLLDALLKAIISSLPEIIRAGIQLVLALVSGIGDALPEIIMAAIELIFSIRQALIDNLPEIMQAGLEVVWALVKGLWQLRGEVFKIAGKLVLTILQAFLSLPSRMKNEGVNLVKALWEGILSMGSWIKDKVSGFFGGIVDGVKGFFGGGGGGDAPDPNGGGPSPLPGGSPSPSGMPGHEDGGIFDKEHVARFAEDDKPEAAVPLTKPARAREVLGQISQYLGGGESGDNGKIAEMVAAVKSFTEQASTIFGQMNTIMTKGTAAAAATAGGSGGITNNYNTYHMESETKVYDQSGNPQGVAKAVDRAQQLRIRNQKGAFK